MSNNNDFNDDEVINIIENAENSPVDVAHKTEATENQGQALPDTEVLAEGEMPDVIESRDSGNSKRLKMVGLGMSIIILVLLGMGVAFSRYQKNKEINKAQQAEEALKKQQKISDGTKLDIASDQQEIANNDFHTLPPPQGAMVASGVQPTTVTPVQPIAPIQTPQTIRNYDNGSPPPVISRAEPQIPTPTANPTPAPTPSNNVVVTETPVVNNTPIPPTPEELKQQRVLGSGVLAYQGSGKATASAEEKQGDFDKNFKGSVMADGSASKRNNLSMLLAKGATIPCVLKTKIVSDYQGFTSCQVSKDVYSTNGKVLLIERGSMAFGEQKVEMKQGKASVFVLWTKIETPKGVSISLDSPATGSLGEMGVPAKVNTHFWKRFGNSIMLSVIQDAFATIASRAEGNGENTGDNNTTIQNTTRTTQSMAEKALENSINIPPTATVKQGTLINILVARDVDFSKVYRLR